MPQYPAHVSTTLVIAGSLAVTCAVYSGVKYLFGKRHPQKRDVQPDELLHLLKAFDKEGVDKEDLLDVINKLIELSAFVPIQIRIHDLDYLDKIANTLHYPDQEVKESVALLINNLSLNENNQKVLKVHIPVLVNLLRASTLTGTTVTLFLAVLKALTNLTTLEDSHDAMLPFLNVLCEILQECDVVQIKVQTLRILVNLSTNDKNCENLLEFDAQLLGACEVFVHADEDERCLLRAVSCVANVLAALHRRWQHGKQPSIATPEFVSSRLRENIVTLTSHHNQDIRLQAGRSLMALRKPVTTDMLTNKTSVDDMDLLDVLKI